MPIGLFCVTLYLNPVDIPFLPFYQMEIWRRELQRVEEDADEEGFEEL